MDEASPLHPELPANYFGVYVEDDMDARRLIYLVQKVGSAKVGRSAANYSANHLGSKIFVSVLLKHYRVRVPTHVYAPVNAPFYRVYLLLHSPSSTFKLGYSGDWTTRANSFDVDFDLDRSIGISFGGDKANAMAAEKAAKKRFQSSRTDPPAGVRFGAYGHKEWFEDAVFEIVANEIACFNSVEIRPVLNLRKAIAHNRFFDPLQDHGTS